MATFQSLFFGTVAVVGGAILYHYAEGLTRFSEQLDAIGSKTPVEEVEPATWNVMLTRIVGAVVAFGGLVLLVGGFT